MLADRSGSWCMGGPNEGFTTIDLQSPIAGPLSETTVTCTRALLQALLTARGPDGNVINKLPVLHPKRIQGGYAEVASPMTNAASGHPAHTPLTTGFRPQGPPCDCCNTPHRGRRRFRRKLPLAAGVILSESDGWLRRLPRHGVK
eukprot:4488640-Amphidinium_carterae.1